MHLVATGDERILLDCGLYRGSREEARRRNDRFPFDPASVDAVVLSHAHTDHCGNLPNLVRQGYSGPIYCTPATRDLIAIMLKDSARIHEDDALVAGIVGRSDATSAGPLYTRGDASQVVHQCVVVPYGETAAITPRCRVRFTDAGHILGSAIVALTLHGTDRDYQITFTGDLGRRGLPFLTAPSTVPAADLIICESTYGGRVHDTLDCMAAKLAAAVRTTQSRGGKVLIPAFSLGRTQLVVHFLQRWMREGRAAHSPTVRGQPARRRDRQGLRPPRRQPFARRYGRLSAGPVSPRSGRGAGHHVVA